MSTSNPSQRRTLPWVLFWISLGFNIAFLAGLAWRLNALDRFDARFFANDYLAPEHRAALKQFRSQFRSDYQAIGQESAQSSKAIWEALLRSPVDSSLLDRELQAIDLRRAQARNYALKGLLEFLDSLPQYQRALLVENRDPSIGLILFGPGFPFGPGVPFGPGFPFGPGAWSHRWGY